MREVIRRLSRNTIEETRPAYRYATVQSVNTTARTATVTYSGESTSVTLPYGGMTPVVGATVRIDGVPGDRHIADVMAEHAHDYAATGHTHWYDPGTPTNAIGNYPDGVSVGMVNSADGWPAIGPVLTVKRTTIRATQYLTEWNNNREWRRTAHSSFAGGWSDWTLIGDGDTGWLEITDLRNGATAYQTGLAGSWTPRCRRMNGVVYLQGLINTNATTTPLHVATLPGGYRPRSTLMENIFVSGANYRRMDIDVNGSIIFREAPAYSTGWHSITTSFPADA